MKRLIKPNTTKQVYFWNMAGSMCNAANTFIMLTLCSWIVGQQAAGIFNLAYPTAQMMQIIGAFELRNIFITDTRKEFRFGDILGFEVMSNLIMVISGVVFVLVKGYTGAKAMSMIVLFMYMVFMNLTDAFGGLFQKNEHLELTGRSLSLDVSLSTVVFGVVLIITRNIVAAFAGLLVTIALWVIFYDLPYARSLSNCRPIFDKQKLFRLLVSCLPLFLTVFLQSYFTTAPRYAVDGYLNDNAVAIFGYIYMPANVINLFSLFLYRPMITTLASDYAKRDFKSLFKIIRKELVYIVGFSVISMILGYLIGAQVLGFVFHANLMPYRWLIVISLVVGMFYALNSFIYYILVIMRYQNMLLISYIVASAFITIIAGTLVKHFGLAGAFSGLAVGMMLVFAILFTSLFVLISKVKAKSQIPPQN